MGILKGDTYKVMTIYKVMSIYRVCMEEFLHGTCRIIYKYLQSKYETQALLFSDLLICDLLQCDFIFTTSLPEHS